MRVRIWPFVSISFAGLLLLVPLFGWIVSRKAVQIDRNASRAHRLYAQADDAITDIRADVYTAALLLRDAATPQDRAGIRERIAKIQSSNEVHFRALRLLLPAAYRPKLERLQDQLTGYWTSAARTVNEVERGDTSTPAYLKKRNDQQEAAVKVAEELDALNMANLSLEEREIQDQQYALRRFAAGATGALLVLGFLIAGGSTVYLARLERISEKQKRRSEQAEFELRRLSNKLVRVQEDERKTISRELHDEVGQILTGLRMELGSLSRGEQDGLFRERLDSVKALAEDALRAVRNLALLLRPSMLDDLGLAPALRWQAREISRRSGIPVSIEIRGGLDELPEAYRICLYRAVQEALTNCTKHSQATRITITVTQEKDLISASIRDNGKGLPENGVRTRGLGLVGLEERVRALQGELTISSQDGPGTLIRVDLPVPHENETEVAI
ncbi:MAG: sensor histidine kinase [Bryobacteraceae bacterium]